MYVVNRIKELSEDLNATEHRRRFRVSSAESGRSCCINMSSCPDGSVMIKVDVAAARDRHIEGRLCAPCDCSHSDGRGSHLRCDYLILNGSGSYLTVVYVEVKTGVSNQQSDVTHGFRQIMCSKSVFESVLTGCAQDDNPAVSIGVVVSPAFALSEQNQRLSSVWGIANGIRLIQVKSGDDVWSKCS